MKARTVISAIAAGAIMMLCACGSTPEASDNPSDDVKPSEQTPAEGSDTAEQEPEPVSEHDNLKACQRLFGDDMQVLWDIPEVINSIGDTITEEQSQQMLDIHAKIEYAIELAEPDLEAELTSLDVPFQQFHDAIIGGGGSLNLSTGNIATDVTEIMQTCVDAGYHADNAR